jgi:hypothetical protein
MRGDSLILGSHQLPCVKVPLLLQPPSRTPAPSSSPLYTHTAPRAADAFGSLVALRIPSGEEGGPIGGAGNSGSAPHSPASFTCGELANEDLVQRAALPQHPRARAPGAARRPSAPRLAPARPAVARAGWQNPNPAIRADAPDCVWGFFAWKSPRPAALRPALKANAKRAAAAAAVTPAPPQAACLWSPRSP